MKKIIILFSAIILVFSSCNTMKIVSDYDKDVNFSKYETYNVLPWDKEESERINEFDQKRIIIALHEQMQARGYKRVASESDVSVNPFLILDAKEQTTAYTTHYNMGGYGYYGGFGYYGFGPGYNMGTTTFQTEQYTVGTLIIDVLDNKTKKLIWQGIGIGTIDDKRENRDKNTPKVISKIMESYPIKPIKK